MNIVISGKIDIPIYKQIVSQMEDLIIRRQIKQNEKLDSVRVLAKKLNVSVITVQHVYSELEKKGYIVSVPNKGYYVQNLQNPILRERILCELEQSTLDIIDKLKAIGMQKDE